jgi:uncharacterized membrane protein
LVWKIWLMLVSFLFWALVTAESINYYISPNGTDTTENSCDRFLLFVFMLLLIVLIVIIHAFLLTLYWIAMAIKLRILL